MGGTSAASTGSTGSAGSASSTGSVESIEAVESPAVESLRAALGTITGREIVGLSRLSGGASRETWAVDVSAPDGDGAAVEHLILQRRRAGGSDFAGDVGSEARLLRAAAAAGVPVPEMVGSGDDDGLGGPWTLCRRVDGEAMPKRLLSDERFDAVRPTLAAACGAALAAVHRMDPSALSASGVAPAAIDELAGLRTVLDGVRGSHPVLELGLRRLEVDRGVGHRRDAVVHGDFRLGNLLVADDGLAAVLDWELAHVGDPIEDLGWFCVRAWRFGSPMRAGGVGTVEQLIDGYVAAGGDPVDPDELRWWELYGTVRWGVICAVQAEAHLNGSSPSVELAAVGRRGCENELDALELLGVEVPAADPSSGDRLAGSPPHDRPSAVELIAAVREFLTDDVRAATNGRVRFHATVAARTLDIVERELLVGTAASDRHAAALASLGVVDDLELVRAIRDGSLDDTWREVAEALAPVVADKVAVANPRYRI